MCYSVRSTMLKKYTGLALALLFVLCEAQELDENEMRIQLENLNAKLHAATNIHSDAAGRLNNIEQEFKYKCPNILDRVKVKFGNIRDNEDSLYQHLISEIINVEHALEDLGNNDKLKQMVIGFPEYKKNIEELLADSDEALHEIDELAKILKTCSASRPADKIVPQSGSTSNIPLASVSLTMAAFIVIKLAFH